MAPNITTTITRPQNPVPARDYDFLREQGIAHLENLASRLWSDFNSHDPGITILELLCYAITDLGYRTSLDDLTLFDPAGKAGSGPSYSFYTPGQIFSNSPLTWNDFRRILIDQPQIANAWIAKAPPVTVEPGFTLDWYHPAFKPDYFNSTLLHVTGTEVDPVCNNLNGLYRVVVEFERDLLVKCDENPASKAAAKQAVIDAATDLLHQNRGLCEDFTFVGGPDGCEQITVRAEIDILPNVNSADVLAQIMFDIETFLIPPVTFYSIEELQEKGLTTDRIFEGPRLTNGFIWETELKNLSKRTEIHVSDLIQVIMDVPGVRAVNDIEVDCCNWVYATQTKTSRTAPWTLILPSGDVDGFGAPLFPDMDFQLYVADIDPGASSQPIQFMSGPHLVSTNYREASAKLEQLRSARKISRLEKKALDIALPGGTGVDLETYSPIQNDLPLAYGTGPEGVVRPATDERLAQARQLKTFLMFFEQILADYFSQLSHAADLLSWDDLPETYFSQLIQDVADLDNLYDTPLTTTDLKDLVEDTGGTEYYARRNKFLDHLMARFSEQMTEYTLLEYAKRDEVRLIGDKQRLLRDYQPVGSERGKAFNYLETIDYTDASFTGTDNISGYQKRVCRLTGIENWQERPLTPMSTGDVDEGMHVVEHIFIRPVSSSSDFLEVSIGPTEGQTCIYDKDPYSFRMTVVLPAWPERFQDYHYRKYIERIIRQEAPAHISVDPKWLSEADMVAFEACWFAYLTEWGKAVKDWVAIENALNCVINVLNTTEDAYDARYAEPLVKNEDHYRTKAEKISQVIDPVGTPILAQTAISPIPILGTPNTVPWQFPSGIMLVTEAGKLQNALTLAVVDMTTVGFTAVEIASLVAGDIVVTDPYTLDTGIGLWVPGGINLPNEAPHGTWQWTINVTNNQGDFSQHVVVIKILNDNESVFTPVTKNIDAYGVDDPLGSIADADGALVNAYLYQNSGGPVIPSWLDFNVLGIGVFSVNNPTAMRTNLPAIATVSGGFYLLNYTVITIDATEGVTKSNVELKVKIDSEATYEFLRCSYNNSYPNEDSLSTGSLLAWVVDADVPGMSTGIVSAVQTGGPSLPSWLTLASNGNITVNNNLFASSGGIKYVDPIDITISVRTTDIYGGITNIPNVRIKIRDDSEVTWTQVQNRILCLCPGDTVVSFHDADAPLQSVVLQSGSSLPPGMKFAANGNIVVSNLTGGGSSYYAVPQYATLPAVSYTQLVSSMEGTVLKPGEQQRGLYPGSINNDYPVCKTNLVPGVYNVKLIATDKCGGKTNLDFNITILADRPASRVVSAIKPVHCYKNGVTVVTFTDPDASIVYAIAKSLPPGLQINNTTGKVTVANQTVFQAALNSNKVQNFNIHTLDACGGETRHLFNINFSTSTTGTGTGIFTLPSMKAANQYLPGERIAGPVTPGGISSARIVNGALPRGLSLNQSTGEILVDQAPSGLGFSGVTAGTENRGLTAGESKVTVAMTDPCGTLFEQEVVIGILDETPEATVEYLSGGATRMEQLQDSFFDILGDNTGLNVQS